MNRQKQQKVEEEVSNIVLSELETVHEVAINRLMEYSKILSTRRFNKEEDEVTEYLIELLVRIESKQQNKGWWFRTKRRPALILKYLS